MPQQTSCEMPRQTTVRRPMVGLQTWELQLGTARKCGSTRDLARTPSAREASDLPAVVAESRRPPHNGRAAGDERLRITIGGKVFGIALLLVVLMGVAAAISSFLVRDAAFAITRVNETYTPLSRAIAEIGIHQLEQELTSLELFADLRDPDADAAAIEARLAALQDRGAKVDEALARGRQLVTQASDDPRYQDNLANLVRLEGLIAGIDREHQDFERQSLRIVDVLQAGGGGVSRVMLDDWHRQEGEFNAELANAIATISGYAATAGEEAQEAERGVRPDQRGADRDRSTRRSAAGGGDRARPGPAGARPGRARPRRSSAAICRPTSRSARATRSASSPAPSITCWRRCGSRSGSRTPSAATSIRASSRACSATPMRSRATARARTARSISPISPVSRRWPSCSRPSAVLRVINGYFTEMSEPIRDNQGIIDKYIGDAIMAFWAPPFTDREDHPRLACLSALAQRERLAAFQARLPELTGLRRSVPPFEMRIGIATGEVVIGNVGSDVSKNYTVIGDTVNLAARLEALNKQYGTRILIAGATEALARGAIETREIDLVAVAGKSEPIRIFELLAAQGRLSPEATARRERFAAALGAYRARDWPAARAGFEACAHDPTAIRRRRRFSSGWTSSPPIRRAKAGTASGIWRANSRRGALLDAADAARSRHHGTAVVDTREGHTEKTEGADADCGGGVARDQRADPGGGGIVRRGGGQGRARLVDANLHGHDSHGVIRVPQYVGQVRSGAIVPNRQAEVVAETDTVTVLDGKFGYGQIMGERSVQVAIDKAARHGLAMSALRHSAHLGRVGDWPEMAAAAGMASLHFVNATGIPLRVVPHGGRDGRGTTNPIAMGMPVPGGAPVILDFATSATAEGKVRVARNKGVAIPPDCLVDAEGQPTTDPNHLYADPPGNLLPFGGAVSGHKGGALWLMCDLLAGGFTGGGCSNRPRTRRASPAACCRS